MNTQSFSTYWAEARQFLVGGVSSSFRYNPFTDKPMYLSKADGAFIYDLDGQRYTDFFMGHGACTLGHNRPEIAEALQQVFDIGFFAEFDHPLTAQLAKKIVELIPCAEQVRYVNSGSEATLLSLRLARGYTGRSKVVRIDGHFHGGHDYALLNNLAAYVDRDNPGDRLPITHLARKMAPVASIAVALALVPLSALAMALSPLFRGSSELAGVAVLHPITLMMVVGIAIQGLGECFLSPRYLEYASKQAPAGQEGLYLGYAHLNTFFAWLAGFVLSGYLLDAFCPDPKTLPAAVQAQRLASLEGPGPMPEAYAHAHWIWLVFAAIGLTAFLLLLAFRFVTERADRIRAAAEGGSR